MQKQKRVYRRENEIKSALVRSDFNLMLAARFLGMTLKALHERLQRTRNRVFTQLRIEQRDSKFIFGDRAIEELLASSPNVDIELYREVRSELKSQDTEIVGHRRAQIAEAVAQACDVYFDCALDELYKLWRLRYYSQMMKLELCRREQKHWEATRKQRRQLRRRHEAETAPRGVVPIIPGNHCNSAQPSR